MSPSRGSTTRVVATAIAVVAVLASGAVPRTAEASTDCPSVAGQRDVPSTDALLGDRLTAGPLGPEDSVRFLDALAAASPRVHAATAGVSDQGRPLRYAIVGDPGLLRTDRRAAIERDVQAIRAGTAGPRTLARASAGPAIVWLGGGVHANEPSGTHALLAAARRLAVGATCADRRVLRRILTVVLPDQNPDGRVTGTRTDASGFDLNRDWFAAARPETRARLALLRRLPPTVAVDLHEQTGSDYFTPPYEPPVLRGVPRATRRFADATIAPVVRRELRRTGVAVTHGAGFDLLYPGYADSATSLLFGAGGMTFEQGSDSPLAEKVDRHLRAVLSTVTTVAAHRRAAIEAWAAGFRPTPRSRTTAPFGWILRTETGGADAWRLARRLQAQGARVRTLRRSTVVDGFRPLGRIGSGPTRLPAGTIVLPGDQPLRAWLDVLLRRDADVTGETADADDTWSLPRLNGVAAGILERPLPARALQPLRPPTVVTPGGDAALRFPGDSLAAHELVVGLLRDGVAVAQDPGGTFVVPATGTTARRVAAAGIAATAIHASPPSARPLVRPDVVVVRDDGPTLIGPPATLPGLGDRPSGWIPATLRDRGIALREVAADALPTALRPGTTHVLLGPGALPAGDLPPDAARALGAAVRGGARVIAVGEAGHAATVAAGLSTVESDPAASIHAVNVAAVAGSDALGRTLGGAARVVLRGDPLLRAPGPSARVVLRAAARSDLTPSGSRAAAAALADRPLVISEPRGAGQVLTVGFSPAFRGQSTSGMRVLLALLLSPRDAQDPSGAAPPE